MFEYGCKDAEDVLFLGMDQLNRLETDYGKHIWENECALMKTCFKMERVGVKVDLNYVNKGMKYEEEMLEVAKDEASSMAKEKYRNGPKWLARAFDNGGQKYDINPKTQNPIFDKHALANMQSPIATVIKDIRRREKYITSYYSSFNYFNNNSTIRSNIRLAGTDTMRFSYADPNLQNIPKEENFEKGEIQVRKCFVPRTDYCFVMIDFDQQEFRLMLDYAGESALIKRIIDEGVDVHQATADMMGVTRKQAKTINFGLLYGMGVEKLAKSLKVTETEARELKALYFSKLPRVQKLIRNIMDTAESRGFIRTWSGRKLYCPNKDLAYAMPNHLIQGGCADIARFAMPELDKKLVYTNSRMVIQVHDEIVFEVHKNDLDIVPDLVKIMEATYTPYNGMKLTCGVEHSWVSWGKQDVINGYPTRSIVQEQSM
jgi:DNA polymerase-1